MILKKYTQHESWKSSGKGNQLVNFFFKLGMYDETNNIIILDWPATAIGFHQSRPVLETINQLLAAFKTLRNLNGSLHMFTPKRQLKNKTVYSLNIWLVLSVNCIFFCVNACMTKKHVPFSNLDNITHFQRDLMLAALPFLWNQGWYLPSKWTCFNTVEPH